MASQLTAWALKLALSIFTREVVKVLFLSLARSYAESNDNKVTDAVVEALEEAFDD